MLPLDTLKASDDHRFLHHRRFCLRFRCTAIVPKHRPSTGPHQSSKRFRRRRAQEEIRRQISQSLSQSKPTLPDVSGPTDRHEPEILQRTPGSSRFLKITDGALYRREKMLEPIVVPSKLLKIEICAIRNVEDDPISTNPTNGCNDIGRISDSSPISKVESSIYPPAHRNVPDSDPSNPDLCVDISGCSTPIYVYSCYFLQLILLEIFLNLTHICLGTIFLHQVLRKAISSIDLGGALKSIDVNADLTFDVTEHYWFPMLVGLSDLTSDPRAEVRNCALEVLFDLLNERGRKFSSAFWESILHRVLFPIFDHVRHAGRENLVSSGDEWLRETSIHSLQLLCNLFNTFYKEVCFMLPPLLGLLLDCAKKTDRAVVSISLGALVHLIEVGGHQFSENDWDTLLKSIRDASYTTQPVELLNSLGFDSSKSQSLLTRDTEINTSDSPSLRSVDNGKVDNHQFGSSENGKIFGWASPRVGVDSPRKNPSASIFQDDYQDIKPHLNLEESEGLPSPSGRSQNPAGAQDFQRSQTLGQRIMVNMMDNLLLRNLTSKSRSRPSDALVPSSPVKIPDAVEPDLVDEEESPLLGTIRGKCITQLLVWAIDSIQKKYWSKLKASQKITIMDILLSVLEFATSYNSYTNLRMRMHHIPAERPPLNLLRQELSGTCIYLDILQKTTTKFNTDSEEQLATNGFHEVNVTSVDDASYSENSTSEEKLDGIAEERLVSFCGQMLKEASDLQSGTGEAANVDVHRVLELRSPIIVKVLNGMCFMNPQIFRKHLREFYPLFTKLVCCDQMDVRGALGDLFSMQLTTLLP